MTESESNSNGESTVKDQIFIELVRTKAVNIRELYALVEKSRSGISYHAVYKALKNLVRHGVVEKQDKGYTISNKWVERVSAFFDSAKRSYMYNKPVYLPGIKGFKESGDTKTFVFENLEEAENYRKRLQWEYLESASSDPYCAMSGHLRSPLFSSERSLNIMSMATRSKSRAFILVASSDPIDEWCADYYRNEFVRVQTGVPCAETCDTMILGDTVVQFYLPTDMREVIDAIYSAASGISDINVQQFYRKVYKEPHDVRLVIIKNSEVAQQLRSQIMSNFKLERLAIFDVNGTLVDEFLVKMFFDYLALVGAVNSKKADEANMFVRAERSGHVTHDKNISKILEIYAGALKGCTVEEIDRLAEKFVEERMAPLFPFSKKLFYTAHSYFRTAAVTKTTGEIMRAFRRVFPFDHLVCSELEVRDGKYTGKIVRNLANPVEKKKAFDAWVKKENISLQGSMGFGNTVLDVGFLNRVSWPVAVKPDDELAKLAGRSKWLVFNQGDDAHKLMRKLVISH